MAFGYKRYGVRVNTSAIYFACAGEVRRYLPGNMVTKYPCIYTYNLLLNIYISVLESQKFQYKLNIP